MGFEPMTSGLWTQWATRLLYSAMVEDKRIELLPDGSEPTVLPLYESSMAGILYGCCYSCTHGTISLAWKVGVEPTSTSFKAKGSAN